MSKSRFNVLTWETQHGRAIDAYASQIKVFYQLAIREAALLATTLPVDSKRPFRFQDYPQTNERVRSFLSDLTNRVTNTIREGTESEWLRADRKNDSLVDAVMGAMNPDGVLLRQAVAQYLSRNLEALSAFQNRKRSGLNLSQRVSKYTGQFKAELELGIDVGLGQGKSADQLSRDLRGYLQQPDRLFRRVRDKRGQLELSKAAKAVHPGQGVYRSSYKNMLRLTKNEINLAYRESDYLRFQSLDFVVGIEVRLSPRHVIVDICDDLKGNYPKAFKFRGWHTNCRCFVVSVLAKPDELRELNRMLLGEEDTSSFRSVNEVTDVNDGFKQWATGNRERVQRSASKPYFVRDNFVSGDISKPLRFKTTAGPVPVPSSSGIDLAQFVAGDLPTNAEMKAIIGEYARLNPDLFAHGFEGLSILKSKSYLMQCSTQFSPKTGQWSGQTHLSVSTHSFSLGGTVFNPAEELRGALGAIKRGDPLSFNQEYSVEGLWHELLHAKSSTPPRRLNRFALQDMETLNQFTARHTYPELLKALGGTPIHQAAILERGYGYKDWVANFRAKIARLGLSEAEVLADLSPYLMDDYAMIPLRMAQYFAAKKP